MVLFGACTHGSGGAQRRGETTLCDGHVEGVDRDKGLQIVVVIWLGEQFADFGAPGGGQGMHRIGTEGAGEPIDIYSAR